MVAEAIDPVAKVVPTVVRFLLRAATEFRDGRTSAFEKAARDELDLMLADHIGELRESFLEYSSALSDRVTKDELARHLDSLLKDPQFYRLQGNYCLEHQREAMDERRIMLDHAAFGSAIPQMSLAEVARTERTIRELDPLDVMLLSCLRDISGTRPRDTLLRMADGELERVKKITEEREACALVVRKSAQHGDVLLSAHCVREFQPNAFDSFDAVEITTLGANVLKVLTGYVNARWPEPADRSAQAFLKAADRE